MSKLIKFFLLSFSLIFIFGGIVLAQETSPEVMEAINLDEDIQPEDLGIGEPRILPDSPFYFLKNWGRGVREFLAFNLITKVELRERFTSEKLMELKKMADMKKPAEAIKRAAENYQGEIEKVKQVTEVIREKAQENPQVEKFLDKFVKHQILHQRLLQKLENQVPPEAFEKIKEARERHLERFGEVMSKLEDRKDKITENLETNMAKIKGSEFKNFKNLQILSELKDRVPEQIKDAVIKAEENALKRLKVNVEQMSSETQEKFQEYLEKISGEKEKQLEIIENLRLESKENPETIERVMILREGIIQGVKQLNCPETEKPAPDFCKEGRVIMKRDERGCVVSFECLIPAEVEIPIGMEDQEVCITLWDPVCGKDEKTYSNICFARLAGVDIAYKGKCRERECQTDADCPQVRCGPAGTISVRCVGLEAKCVDGKCQILSISTELAP